MLYAQTRICSEKWDAEILWDFETKRDLLIPVRWQYQVIVGKKTKKQKKNNKRTEWWTLLFRRRTDWKLKKTKKRQVLRPSQRNKLWNMRVWEFVWNMNYCTWKDSQRLVHETDRVVNWKTRRDHPNYDISEIGKNTEKRCGNLRRLAIIQIPLKDHQLTPVWKTTKE